MATQVDIRIVIWLSKPQYFFFRIVWLCRWGPVVILRLPKVVEGGSEGYVVGILPAGARLIRRMVSPLVN